LMVPTNDHPVRLTHPGVFHLHHLGAPMLGEFKGIGERGELQFELEVCLSFPKPAFPVLGISHTLWFVRDPYLEANNYNGELRSKNFLDGETGSKFAIEPPGFFQNLLSGGKLQGEWEEKMKQVNSAAEPPAKKRK